MFGPADNNNPTILTLRVDTTSYERATNVVLDWALRGESRYVCAANVHMTMEAYDHPQFREVVNGADLVTPDGMPLVWILRRMGQRDQQRVYGPTLMLHVCEAAEKEGVPIGLFGSRLDILERLLDNLKDRFPKLKIAYAHSPPFRKFSESERQAVTNDINCSGTRILFVGLGCPKQEQWMAAHRGQVKAVMLGVGAAFDFHAGSVRQAPGWIQSLGLEWCFRLLMEPRRLWRRYLIHNLRFIFLITRQLLGRNESKEIRH